MDEYQWIISLVAFAYKKERTEEDGHIQLAAYSLLIVQIKYDLTSEIISPESYFKIQLKDYESAKDALVNKTNQITRDLELNNSFLVKG